MKYKLVVKTRWKTFVKSRSKKKENLEDLAIKITKKNPTWKVYILREDQTVE